MMRHIHSLCLTAFLVAISLVVQLSTAAAHGRSTEEPEFQRDIFPILKNKCTQCHNPNDLKAELDLTTPYGLFKGGESGVVIEPGKPEESVLYEMVHEGLMPPDGGGEPLTEQELHTIEAWIKAGSPFADGTNPETLLSGSQLNQHDIQPIFLTRCTSCHGRRIRKGELDLRTRESILKGGKSGPAMVTGKPQESLLLKRIHAEEMPPRDQLIIAGVKPITGDEVEKISNWIRLGAPTAEITPDAATNEPDHLVTNKDREHWSFKRLPVTVAVPNVDNTDVHPIDAFIMRQLSKRELAMNPEADKMTLLRRASFDLTGLPPTAEQVRVFVNSSDPQVYEKVIDQLLDSPRYGERWGRFWLDAAGYADSEGKRSSDPVRKYAYRYRDYVIRAFNKDKPYSRFLLEQIAGDELEDYSDPSKVTPQIVDNLVATGFLRMAPDGTGSDVVNTVVERMEVVADELDIFGSTVLGLTLKCARCHSHKYDPIPHRDYYRLVSVFQGAYDVHDWLKPVSAQGQSDNHFQARTLDIALPEERKRITGHNHAVQKKIDAEQVKLAELAAELRKKALDSGLANLPETIRNDTLTAVTTQVENRDQVQKYLAGKFENTVTLTDDELKTIDPYKILLTAVTTTVEDLEEQKETVAQIRGLWDRGEPSPTYVFRRGDHRQPGRLVGPGVPSALTDGQTPFEPVEPWSGAAKTGRRRALAEWLIEPDHPLTARVMINRIWKHHFGRGIVSSIDNFGKLGALPTHPALLNWIAREFVNESWSIKQMHRLIMTSRTYRQSSAVSDEHLKGDPSNKWLSRMPMRRLEAEEIRDALIYVAGALDETPFGKPDEVSVAKEGLVVAVSKDGRYRRSVYLRQRRKEMPTFLETFDLPQMNPACQTRANSNVAQQALYLLNNKMVRDLAHQFAKNLAKHSEHQDEQVRQLYLTVLNRMATDEEVRIGADSLSELTETWAAFFSEQPEDRKDDAGFEALRVYCHTILNSADFLFVD